MTLPPYILHYSSVTIVTALKKVFSEVGLNEDQIVRQVALLFEKTFSRIHGIIVKFSVAEVKIETGVEDTSLLNTDLTVFALLKQKTDELEVELIKLTFPSKYFQIYPL